LGAGQSTRNLERAFTNALRKAKIENLRFHDLRHTFARRLAMAEKDLYVIQKLLGHRDPRMVQRYSHHSVESLRKGIEALESEIVKRQTDESGCVTIPSHSGSI
jgi:integrase